MKKYFLKIYNYLFVILSAFFAPLVASAAGTGSCSDGLTSVICKLNDFLGSLLPFLVALGVVYFVWGIVQYFINDSDEAKTKGKDRIIYGLIGLAVIISVWGLVHILVDTLGVGQGDAPNVSSLVTQSTTSSSCTLHSKFQGLLDYFTCIIGQSVIPFIFALAVAMFIWGAVNFFIINAGDEAKRTQGKQFMLWGIIALAVMISIWGLVSILSSTFGISGSVLPQVSPNSSSSSSGSGSGSGSGSSSGSSSGSGSSGLPGTEWDGTYSTDVTQEDNSGL